MGKKKGRKQKSDEGSSSQGGGEGSGTPTSHLQHQGDSSRGGNPQQQDGQQQQQNAHQQRGPQERELGSEGQLSQEPSHQTQCQQGKQSHSSEQSQTFTSALLQSSTKSLSPAWSKKTEPSAPPTWQPASAWGKKEESPAPPSTAFPIPAWGKKVRPSAPATMQPPTLVVDATQSNVPEAKSARKKKGRGQNVQKLSMSAVSPPSTLSENPQSPPLMQSPARAIEASQSAQTEAKPAGKKKGKAKGQCPEAQMASTSLAPPPPSTSAVVDVVKKTEQLALKTYTLPIKDKKHEHTIFLKTIVIEVNYLPLKIKDPKLRIYHYDVQFNPDKPKYLLRPALETFRERNFGDRHPAFDGMKNLYVAGRPLREIRDTVTVPNKETGKDKEFDIAIKLANDNLNIAKLFEYCSRGMTSSIPQTEIQATDIALRSGLTPAFTPAGRSFFAKPDEQINLGVGMELWHGFYQSAVMGSVPYLNIDVANKAFPIAQTVLKFMEVHLHGFKEEEELNAFQKRDLERFIKGLKIEYKMPKTSSESTVQRRIYKVDGLADKPSKEKFKLKDDGPMISVELYYLQVKGYRIRCPELPLLRIGTKGSMVPIECCKIVEGQTVMRKLDETQTAKMVKAAARPTTERKRRIEHCIKRASYSENPMLKEFGIEVQTSFEKVNAVVMNPPQIAYKRKEVKVRDGIWRLERDNFLEPSLIPPWVVLNLNKSSESNISVLEKLIVQVGRDLGMNFPIPKRYVTIEQINEQELIKKLSEFGKNGVRLVFVILSSSDDIYGQVKRASELRAGVLTQCIKSKTMLKINIMTVTNILLKVNSKLKGVNHKIAYIRRPAVFNQACMLVGADVTHPSPGAENSPSIAAVAASHDEHGFKYKMMYRLQPSREEMIIDLAEIMKAQLSSYFQVNGYLPSKILYFRDGVSEGQFQKVLAIEYEAIRKAWMTVNRLKPPMITFLVVQKRHHTRFFPNPKDGDQKNFNVPAGTLVDTKITHPTEVDFYLVSHQSIQGTARPTKYHLLWDDCKIPQVELEKITYYLCHMFSRCTRSVSYPAPTYYAHLAAFRARAWWDRMSVDMTQLKKEQDKKGVICADIINEYPMFFV